MRLLSAPYARPLSSVLVATQIAVSVPRAVTAQDARRQAAPQVQAGTNAAARVNVNRRVPNVTPVPLHPEFSGSPSDAEITRARVFDEPITPAGGVWDMNENRALATAIRTYLLGGGGERVEPMLRFLSSHPGSRWRPSVLTGLGIVYRRTGYLARALAAWNEAWALTKESKDPTVAAVADRAVGELFALNARLGRYETLERLFEEIHGRDVRGSASEKVSGARQALWLMHNKSDEAFRCGPLALYSILRAAQADLLQPRAIQMCKSTKQGTSLPQLRDVSEAVGAPMRMAKRETGAHVYVPAVIHWKVGHFAALVQADGFRYLVRDPTFGDEFWVSQAAIDEEASGYFLIRPQPLVPGWLPVDDYEGARVWGRGQPAGGDDTDINDCCGVGSGGGGGGGGDGRGMASASIHFMLASIRIKDIPVGYAPPVGPDLHFRVTYNQRDAYQPQTFYYSNLGPKWTLDWLSFLEDDPNNAAAAVTLYQRNGGRETSTGYVSGTQSYAATVRTQAVVKRVSTSPIVYERQLPDGSVEVFGQPDGAQTFPRKVFLTALKDSDGNTLTFTYDGSLRLVAATDAIGQVTTLSYEHSDPLKITKVTDPFGRFATFEYDSLGRLQRITDVIGLQSLLTYGANDVVKTLTTPYGTSSFTVAEIGINRWAEITDPLGGKERVQYGYGITYSEPAALVPTGMTNVNAAIDHHNTLYWDKRAMALKPGDPTAATDYHWALVSSGAYQAAAVPLSVKRPLENRVWYNYSGGGGNNEGTVRRVIAVGRVLDDGTTQLTKTEVNSRGQTTKRIDPLNRETQFEYDSTGLKVTAVRQKNGGSTDLLETRTYGAGYEPLTITDAAGQTTTLTYNTRGQVLTVTNAKSETTTYAYNPNGYLTSVTGPVSGATTTFTYDGNGRLRTTTDADSYTVTTDYDAFDRPTRTTYPDSTYDETIYRYLDVQQRRDRLGRITRYAYDAARRLTSVRDPLGRTVTQEWCGCGSLDALVDGNGNRTSWERDVLGRVTREVRANGSDTDYVYETTTSRLRKVTDAKNQETNYSYFKDDQIQQMTYTNAQIATPSLSFTYDAVYGRVATMVDGTGTTTYAYHPVTIPPALGATQLASVDGPLTNDTITYGYDQLGRVTARAINGAANTVTWALDALGRVTSETNVLGTFTYTYDGATSRLATVTYPNNQTSTYSYFGNSGDRRLQTIHHQYPNASTLSKFDYTYDVPGNILTWRQQADATAVLWRYGYDTADQLIAAVKESTDPTPVVLKRYGYGYDPAGNRLGEQIDDVLTGASYNTMNQLVSQQPAGGLRFEGTVSEPATVTIAGKPAAVTSTNRFEGSAAVVSGTNTVAVTATDPSGNSRTNTYEVQSTGSTKTFTYDANGNLTSDGTRAFEWDARNQLVAINEGTHRSEFTYDGLQRRVRVVEKENSVVQSDTKVVWCRDEICEQRAADGATVTRRALSRGEQRSGVARLFASDHLGSVTEVTDNSAALIARYGLDPWGRRVIVAGTDATEVGFTGHEVHSAGGVVLALYRAYDPELGRWLSSDPLGDADGPNRYAYVSNRPVGMRDMLGLQGMNASEARLCITNPFDCGKVKGCRDDAFNATVKKFGRQGHNDTSDAFRHCYWSCCMAQKIGAEEAKRFGDAHENFPGNPCEERDMDFYNNDVGRRVGSSNPKGDCGQLCNPKDLQCAPKKCKP